MEKVKDQFVVKQNMNYLNVGDEALLHSKFGKTCVSKIKLLEENFGEKKALTLLFLMMDSKVKI